MAAAAAVATRHPVAPNRARKRHAVQALPCAAALLPLAVAVAPICFSAECQADADRAFLLAVAAPMLAAVAAAALVARPPPQELRDSGAVFEDDATGSLFQNEAGAAEPERDKDGLLAFRAISYTPWPVPRDYEGERLRISVGPVRDRKPRTYVFNKLLPQPSELVVVSLPRPMGVVLEWDAARRMARVVGVVPGSAAEQRRRQAALNPGLLRDSVQDGDVLRAATCTNFVYPTRALFGAVPPERHVVVYGADKQAKASVWGAMRKGEVKDGDVTLVLERRLAAGSSAAAAAPAPAAAAASGSSSSSGGSGGSGGAARSG